MVGWDANEQLAGHDLVSQARQALRNIVAVLACDGGRPEHVVRLTWYTLDRDVFRIASVPLGDAYREVMGRHFPAMSVVEVSALVEPGALVEIEATAVVPWVARSDMSKLRFSISMSLGGFISGPRGDDCSALLFWRR